MRLFLPISLLLFFLFSLPATNADESVIWIGTGGKGAKGIYRTTLNAETGKLSDPTLAVEIGSPGFLCISPDGQRVYSTCNLEKGSVAAFRISQDGKTLELINSQPIGDGGSAHVSLDTTGKILFSAQYGGGSTASFPVNEDGSIGPRASLIEHEGSGPNEARQKSPHPHWTGVDPANQYVFVPDLGNDKIMIHRIDHEKSTIHPHGYGETIAGGGPRHMKFSSDARYAYLLNELLMSVSVFRYDASLGTLERFQTISTLPEDLQEVPNKASEIRIHPSGKFVYAANRGHDSIAVFQVNNETGELSFVEREAIRGSWPRNFNIDPSGKWLIAAGRYSNTLSVFEIDGQSGELIFSGNITNCPAPICLEFGKN